MERYAKLTYTSNPSIAKYIGCNGYLSCDENGRYAFRVEENGDIIQTSAAKAGTLLGDINHPVCRNVGFETRSGSAYQFDFMDVERLVDGVRKVGNRFVGFERDYKVGDHVFDENGVRGVVIEVENRSGGRQEMNVALENGATCWYNSSQLKHDDVSLNNRLQDANVKAAEANSTNRGQADIEEVYPLGGLYG